MTRKRPSRAAYFKKRRAKAPAKQIIAIDGEGYTTESGDHLYTFMAACTETESVSMLSNPLGIQFPQFAQWLLSLPKEAVLVGYSLGYDRTKWVESLPNAAIYNLFHPEKRRAEKGRMRSVVYRDYRINLVSSLFTVTRRGETRSVWDVFKFFQSSFVKALRAWKIGTDEQINRIEKMKAQRGSFEGINRTEQDYCKEECMLLAKLVRELVEAHDSEDIDLAGQLYGPGSTASAILKKLDAETQTAHVPRDMLRAVLGAFFGGRFECSHTGPISRQVYSYDIASAYPYALAQIPCLCAKHGKWVNGGKKLPKSADLAVHLFRLRVEPHPNAPTAWGPLPCRSPTGEIVFPSALRETFAWSAEVYQAARLHPGVKVIESWRWKSRCKCPHPFQQTIADLYCRRLSWGKAARGLVLKLGLNSLYGKSAQKVGSARFQCFVRAGLITSFTRSMLLEALLCAKDPWDVLELATDSVLSKRPLKLPKHKPLGTEDSAHFAGKSPLGAWEPKKWSGKGVFLIRPGLRFPIDENEEQSYTAARGIGTNVLHENRRAVMAAWRDAPLAETSVQQPTMFHGAKSSIRHLSNGEYVRDDLYGRWSKPKPHKIGYQAAPKRADFDRSTKDARLTLRDFRNLDSIPYLYADESPLGIQLAVLREAQENQPSAEPLTVV